MIKTTRSCFLFWKEVMRYVIDTLCWLWLFNLSSFQFQVQVHAQITKIKHENRTFYKRKWSRLHVRIVQYCKMRLNVSSKSPSTYFLLVSCVDLITMVKVKRCFFSVTESEFLSMEEYNRSDSRSRKTSLICFSLWASSFKWSHLAREHCKMLRHRATLFHSNNVFICTTAGMTFKKKGNYVQ